MKVLFGPSSVITRHHQENNRCIDQIKVPWISCQKSSLTAFFQCDFSGAVTLADFYCTIS